MEQERRRTDREKERIKWNSESQRGKETYKEDEGGEWEMEREKKQNSTIKPEWEQEQEERGEETEIKPGETVFIISFCHVGK